MEIALLRTVPLFRKLTDDELREFGALLSLREFQPKEQIVEEGKPIKNFYIVFDGVVYIRRLSGKRNMLLGRMGPGGFFGEINLFDPSVATASVHAMRPSRIASVDDENFHRFTDAHPAIGYKIVSAMMTEMSRRLRQTSARLVNAAYWANAQGAIRDDSQETNF